MTAIPYRNAGVSVTGPRGRAVVRCLVPGCEAAPVGTFPTKALAAAVGRRHRDAHRDAYWEQHLRLGLGQTEAQWQAKVVEYARLRGWTDFHHRVSKGTRHGWPDLALIRPPRLVLVELKRQDGRVTVPQQRVLAQLDQCDGVEVFTWRPSNWPEVEQVLR